MEFKVEHPSLASEDVVIRTSLLTSTKVIVNGMPLKGKFGGKYEVPTAGTPVNLQVVAVMWDPVPSLKINGEKYLLQPPLPWYGYAICSMPLLLLFIGGAIGAMFGMAGLIGNITLARSSFSLPVKAAGIFASTTAAVVAWLVGAVAIQVLVNAL